jgi:hypothetical protein
MVNIVDDVELINVSVFGGTQDLMTYALFPGIYFSVSPAQRVNFVGLPRNASPDVYLQSPLMNLTDFELRYHVHISELQDSPTGGEGTNKSGGFITSLFTRDATHYSFQDIACPTGTGLVGNGLGMNIRSLWVGTEAQPKHIFAVYNQDNAICPNPPSSGQVFEFVYWVGPPNTAPALDIYVKLIKTGSIVTEWLYSDANMTQLLLDANGVPFLSTGRTISGINAAPYTYFVAVGCRGDGNGNTVTGYMENFQFI